MKGNYPSFVSFGYSSVAPLAPQGSWSHIEGHRVAICGVGTDRAVPSVFRLLQTCLLGSAVFNETDFVVVVWWSQKVKKRNERADS